jgi:predicted transcriptional regulator
LIDVTPQDFLKLHSGLVRMLRALEQAEQLPTTKAGEQVFNSRTHGWRILVRAAELGYITRTRTPRPGGGHPYVMNKLTEKGRQLLSELGE